MSQLHHTDQDEEYIDEENDAIDFRTPLSEVVNPFSIDMNDVQSTISFKINKNFEKDINTDLTIIFNDKLEIKMHKQVFKELTGYEVPCNIIEYKTHFKLTAVIIQLFDSFYKGTFTYYVCNFIEILNLNIMSAKSPILLEMIADLKVSESVSYLTNLHVLSGDFYYNNIRLLRKILLSKDICIIRCNYWYDMDCTQFVELLKLLKMVSKSSTLTYIIEKWCTLNKDINLFPMFLKIIRDPEITNGTCEKCKKPLLNKTPSIIYTVVHADCIHYMHKECTSSLITLHCPHRHSDYCHQKEFIIDNSF